MEELAAQRRDLERLDGVLGELGVVVRGNAGLLAETTPRVGDLERAVSQLAGRVDELGGAGTDDDDEPATGPYDDTLLTAYGLLPDPGHQVDWHLMSADQARPAWEALAAWVAHVGCGRLGFTRAQLPDCWALHPEVVTELSWAHQLHRAYAGKGVGPVAIAEWHTRWLPHLRARLGAVVEAVVRLELDDPLRGHAIPNTSPRPACRLGHYHHLAVDDRRAAETRLDQTPTRPPGEHYSADLTALTGLGLRLNSRTDPRTDPRAGARAGMHTVAPEARDTARRELAQRREHAQHVLDHEVLQPGVLRARPWAPGRARYLPPQPADDDPDTYPPAEQRSHPGLWLHLYRAAAAEDLAARRHRHHQPRRVDVTLDDVTGKPPAAGGPDAVA